MSCLATRPSSLSASNETRRKARRELRLDALNKNERIHSSNKSGPKVRLILNWEKKDGRIFIEGREKRGRMNTLDAIKRCFQQEEMKNNGE